MAVQAPQGHFDFNTNPQCSAFDCGSSSTGSAHNFVPIDQQIADVQAQIEETSNTNQLLTLLFKLSILMDHKQKNNNRDMSMKDTRQIMDLSRQVRDSYNSNHSVTWGEDKNGWVTYFRCVIASTLTNIAGSGASIIAGMNGYNSQTVATVGQMLGSMMSTPTTYIQQKEEALRSVLNALKGAIEAEKQRLGQESQPDQSKMQQLQRLQDQIDQLVGKIFQ